MIETIVTLDELKNSQFEKIRTCAMLVQNLVTFGKFEIDRLVYAYAFNKPTDINVWMTFKFKPVASMPSIDLQSHGLPTEYRIVSDDEGIRINLLIDMRISLEKSIERTILKVDEETGIKTYITTTEKVVLPRSYLSMGKSK